MVHSVLYGKSCPPRHTNGEYTVTQRYEANWLANRRLLTGQAVSVR